MPYKSSNLGDDESEGMLFKIIVALIICAASLGSIHGEENVANKINGISVVGSKMVVSQDVFEPICNVNTSWVCLIPYAYTSGAPELVYDLSWQWWGETTKGIATKIVYAQEQGLKVMLKPQVWVRGGTFTGDLTFNSEEDWEAFEQDYASYILHYAKLAQNMEVPLFCIGTEWKTFVQTRPKLWLELIGEIKQVYNGKLVYAANWDNYQNIDFWSQMDYIGINAYFPLHGGLSPSTKDIIEAWDNYATEISKFQIRTNLPVLFTEFGYRSTSYTTNKPWESYTTLPVNIEAQSNAYEAVFSKFWNQPWFAGGFVWKWHCDHSSAGGNEDTRFTPQNKPAEKVIKEWFGR